MLRVEMLSRRFDESLSLAPARSTKSVWVPTLFAIKLMTLVMRHSCLPLGRPSQDS